MGGSHVEQGGQLTSELSRMRIACIEADELARQRCPHDPSAHSRLPRVDISEIKQQRWLCRLVIDIATIDLETYEQSLVIFGDSGLRGFNRRIRGGAVAVVADAHAQRERNDGLITRHIGIFRVHEPRQEVIEYKLRLWPY